MRTVKEVSNLTGISVRTLHYYDEIGLLKPTGKSEAGYRLYDDKALETLQQVLFFREFDIPLKEIKAVMANPALDRNQILQMQRKMLTAKKERMERLIASIDDILKGENKMDFAVFSKTEIEEMFQTMVEHMPENMRNIAIKEFGSIEQWKKHYMEAVKCFAFVFPLSITRKMLQYPLKIEVLFDSLKGRMTECRLQILENKFPAPGRHISQRKGFNPCV